MEDHKVYLACERNWVYYILIGVAGFFGAYTYVLRGGVFCNAQTGNVMLMGLALGSGDWMRALYFLIPLSAYVAGAFLSELVPYPVKHRLPIRWDTLLIAIEMLVIVALGFVPESWPVQISQVAINFIASMQYNTFRQAEGMPAATTFVTNHIRQIGVGLATEIRHRRDKEKPFRRPLIKHSIMMLLFLLGTAVGAVFCHLLAGKAIWLTLLPFAVVLGVLVHADLTSEKNRLEQKPAGH